MLEGEPPLLLTPFGAAHILALAVTFGIGFLLIYISRSYRWPAASGRITVMISVILITSYPMKILARYIDGIDLDIDVIFPFHLCDVAAVSGFFALVLRHRLSAELTFFFGLAATIQALFTPSTCYDFPSISYFAFFQLHSTVVITAFFLPLALQWRPRKGAVIRVWLCGLCYAIFVGIFDYIANANYGFLREKAEGSLMEVLHEEPYHVIEMAVLALVLFFLLALPFTVRSKKKIESI